MWCSSCRADVAAELSSDNRRMLCARCQMELGVAAVDSLRVAPAPRTTEAERDARELLARWSTQNLDLTHPPIAKSPGASESLVSPAKPLENNPNKSEHRFDAAESVPPAPTGPTQSACEEKSLRSAPLKPPVSVQVTPVTDEPPLDRPVSRPRKSNRRRRMTHQTQEENLETRPRATVDRATVSGVPRQELSHDQLVRAALQRQLDRGSSWSALAGQLCAYGGVCLLTCGTVLVMWSYFGGPTSYMPTGWLTAAVGQMLLFLGVVTLISSGMEQTVHEVSWRVDHLASEIHEMSISLDELEEQQRQWHKRNSSQSMRRSQGERPREAA